MQGILETERLFLRKMTMEDFDSLYVVLADSDIMQHYPYSFDSVMNKVTGVLLFILPLTFSIIPLIYSAIPVCAVATFAAVQEGHFIRSRKV